MRTTALFDLPAVPAPQTAAAPRTPLPLGELPVSCVPAAYDREHLYSPSAAYIEDVGVVREVVRVHVRDGAEPVRPLVPLIRSGRAAGLIILL